MVFGLLLLEYTPQDCEYITKTMGRPWIMVFTAWICEASLSMLIMQRNLGEPERAPHI